MTADHIIEKIREAMYGSMDKPLNSADRLRVVAEDPELFTDYISEDAEWAIESLEALLSALKAAEAERDALRKALEDMRPHIEKLSRCVRINDEMGRVVTGQTEAITALAEIHARTLAGDNHE